MPCVLRHRCTVLETEPEQQKGSAENDEDQPCQGPHRRQPAHHDLDAAQPALDLGNVPTLLVLHILQDTQPPLHSALPLIERLLALVEPSDRIRQLQQRGFDPVEAVTLNLVEGLGGGGVIGSALVVNILSQSESG